MVRFFQRTSRFLAVAWILFQGCDADVRCRGDDGAAVDWYILYKLPKRHDDGLSYMYMDESAGGWTLSRQKVNSASGALANTLRPLLNYYDRNTEDFGYMLYNDQPPPPYVSPASFGHSKGVVMLDRSTGVWLSHSTPKFPTYRSKDFWPTNGDANAQTFMCVTFSYDAFRNIGVQLMYIHVYSYDYDIPKTFHNELRCVAQRRCYPKTPPWFSVIMLTSAGNRNFLSVAKYSRFGDDLYSGLIVNVLKQNLFVKSWGRLRGPLPSNCSAYHVHNVDQVRLNNMEPFPTTVDHSKWCVTEAGDATCVADMNREVSQMSRGGGAICIGGADVRKAFTEAIARFEPCTNEELSRGHRHTDL